MRAFLFVQGIFANFYTLKINAERILYEMYRQFKEKEAGLLCYITKIFSRFIEVNVFANNTFSNMRHLITSNVIIKLS